MSIEKQIMDFIVTTLLKKTDIHENITDTYPLIETGIIDSLGILKLLSFLEEKFNIHIMDEELIPENFDTVQSISSLIKGKIK